MGRGEKSVKAFGIVVILGWGYRYGNIGTWDMGYRVMDHIPSTFSLLTLSSSPATIFTVRKQICHFMVISGMYQS